MPFPRTIEGRRRALVALAAATLLPLPTLAAGDSIRILIQSSPLAGAQYHALAEVRDALRVGDLLSLVREPENRRDRRAIRVEWRGRKLGYLPRAENRVVAAALDRGERLVARIARLRDDPDPWRRVEIEVLAEL